MACREHRGFQWKLRRQVDRLDAYFVGGTDKTYPNTKEAIQQLQLAVDSELSHRRPGRQRPTWPPTGPTKKRSRPDDDLVSGPSRRHYERARRYKIENELLKAKLSSHKASVRAKGQATGGISQEWITNIFLTAPGQNARGLTKAFRDVVAVDKNPVSRPTIEKVRGAWVEFYKKMVTTEAARRVAGGLHAARISGVAFVAVIGLHVQDEADIRLRSGIGGVEGVPGRSRASKVQQHVFQLATSRGTMELPMELEALGDKTAKTLCTSLELVTRSIADNVLLPATGVGAKPQASASAKLRGKPQADIWFFHILVGDAINTNDKAARLLWACIEEKGLGPGIRYFLLVIVCGTHQVGLVAKSAVTGRAAASVACGARGLLHLEIAGVTVRLFKYLIRDYYEEFVVAVNEWVCRDLEIVMPSEADAPGQASPLSLRVQQRML